MTPKLHLLASADDRAVEASDASLLASCARGDTDALGVLFDRREADVRRFLFRLSGADARDLDDLVQATFLEALRASPRFRGASQVKTWLFGIAVNVARHHARGEVRKKAFLVSLAAEPSSDRASTDDVARHRQQLTRMHAAITALPHALRAAIVLCDIEAVAGTDAARALGVPVGTLWRRLFDARRRLRDTIGEP